MAILFQCKKKVTFGLADLRKTLLQFSGYLPGKVFNYTWYITSII